MLKWNNLKNCDELIQKNFVFHECQRQFIILLKNGNINIKIVFVLTILIILELYVQIEASVHILTS